MVEHELDLDEQRRLEALRMAVGQCHTASTPEIVVRAAKEYYDFLRGKE